MRAFWAQGVGALRRGRNARVTSVRFLRTSASAHSIGYGIVAQLCSSATNFLLAVIAGHVLGPSGLGTLFIGYAAYVSLLSMERALLTEPLIAASSARGSTERTTSASHTLTLALAVGLPTAALLAVAGTLLPPALGRGMILFAPWLVPALIQDMGRSIVFRDNPGRKTALSDSAWLLTMVAAAPVAFITRSEWAVVGCWGVGSVAGLSVAMIQVGWRLSSLRIAFRWWKAELWRFGRWLGLQAAFRSVFAYTGVLALAGILGATDYGGLRAVYAAFAPLSLLGPAVALPGLPLVSRTLSVSPRKAFTASTYLGLLITLLTGAYVAVVLVLPGALSILFGTAFNDFQSILLPIGLGQLFIAPTYGLTLFLMAQQRGRMLLLLGLFLSVSQLLCSVFFASRFGLTGAAWGGAVVASSLSFFVFIAASRRSLPGD